LRAALSTIRQAGTRPINVNFFCHQPPEADDARDRRWKDLLQPYYRELGADFDAPTPVTNRAPFNEAACEVVEAFRPEVVSFHFGLPEKSLLDRVKATGAKVLSSATTVEEAIWLEQHGCDAIIAMGLEAGGHRGMFLSDDLNSQIGLSEKIPWCPTRTCRASHGPRRFPLIDPLPVLPVAPVLLPVALVAVLVPVVGRVGLAAVGVGRPEGLRGRSSS